MLYTNYYTCLKILGPVKMYYIGVMSTLNGGHQNIIIKTLQNMHNYYKRYSNSMTT